MPLIRSLLLVLVVGTCLLRADSWVDPTFRWDGRAISSVEWFWQSATGHLLVAGPSLTSGALTAVSLHEDGTLDRVYPAPPGDLGAFCEARNGDLWVVSVKSRDPMEWPDYQVLIQPAGGGTAIPVPLDTDVRPRLYPMPDGKVVIAGSRHGVSGLPNEPYEIPYIDRRLPDGRLDPTFASDLRSLSTGGATLAILQAFPAANGDIVAVVGNRSGLWTGGSVIRLSPDGTLVWSTPSYSFTPAMGVDEQGRFAGVLPHSTGPLLRINPDGKIDPAYRGYFLPWE